MGSIPTRRCLRTHMKMCLRTITQSTRSTEPTGDGDGVFRAPRRKASLRRGRGRIARATATGAPSCAEGRRALVVWCTGRAICAPPCAPWGFQGRATGESGEGKPRPRHVIATAGAGESDVDAVQGRGRAKPTRGEALRSSLGPARRGGGKPWTATGRCPAARAGVKPACWQQMELSALVGRASGLTMPGSVRAMEASPRRPTEGRAHRPPEGSGVCARSPAAG